MKEKITSETTKIISKDLPNCNCLPPKKSLLFCITCSTRANEIARDKLVFFSSTLSQEMLGEHQKYYLILDYYITEQTIDSLETINESIIKKAEKLDKEFQKESQKRKKRESANAANAANAKIS